MYRLYLLISVALLFFACGIDTAKDIDDPINNIDDDESPIKPFDISEVDVTLSRCEEFGYTRGSFTQCFQDTTFVTSSDSSLLPMSTTYGNMELSLFVIANKACSLEDSCAIDLYMGSSLYKSLPIERNNTAEFSIRYYEYTPDPVLKLIARSTNHTSSPWLFYFTFE